jgi:PhnB protein
MKLFTHLNFPGTCAEAFQYYEQHLGGKILAMMKQGEAPGANPKSADNNASVIHARMMIGKTVLIGNDVPPDIFQPMRSVYLYLAVDSAEEAERVYGLLAPEGEVFSPLQETYFASRFSQFRDRFGTSWSLIHERPMP